MGIALAPIGGSLGTFRLEYPFYLSAEPGFPTYAVPLSAGPVPLTRAKAGVDSRLSGRFLRLRRRAFDPRPIVAIRVPIVAIRVPIVAIRVGPDGLSNLNPLCAAWRRSASFSSSSSSRRPT